MSRRAAGDLASPDDEPVVSVSLERSRERPEVPERKLRYLINAGTFRRRMNLFPIPEARCRAADLSGDLLLPDAAVEENPAEVLAQGPEGSGVGGPGLPSPEVDAKTYARTPGGSLPK